MKKGILYDYGCGRGDLLIEKLAQENVMETLVWIDNTELFKLNCKNEQRTPSRLPNYDWFNLREARIENYQYKAISQELADELFENFYDFALKAGREDIKAHANICQSEISLIYENSSIYALQNIFFILVEFFAQMITEQKIDLIYFNAIPHEGSDYILYLVAKKLNVRTLFAEAFGVFPQKVFIFENIDDFGKFSILDQLSEKEQYKIQKKHTENMPFRRDLYEFVYKDNIITALVGTFSKTNNCYVTKKKRINIILKSILIGFLKPISTSKLINIISRLTIHLNFSRFKNQFDKCIVKNPDLNEKFVFFPLHTQPEASTSALATKYGDQLLAIEKISNIIPDDWMIYVKDHYPQREWQRDPVFFTRMNSLKKVKYINRLLNSLDLIEKSQFVATITGTVGWESIIQGKNVLTFGNCWYRELPGFFAYNENLNLCDIMNYQINEKELEEKISDMLSKTINCYISSEYSKQMNDFELEKNYVDLAKGIKRILNFYEKRDLK